MPETNQSFSTSHPIKRTSSVASPSNYTPWSSETLTSQEKKHYKKALKEIYETVKMRTQTLGTGTGISEEFSTQSDTGTVQLMNTCLLQLPAFNIITR